VAIGRRSDCHSAKNRIMSSASCEWLRRQCKPCALAGSGSSSVVFKSPSGSPMITLTDGRLSERSGQLGRTAAAGVRRGQRGQGSCAAHELTTLVIDTTKSCWLHCGVATALLRNHWTRARWSASIRG
jgi:hypothetical protein